MSVQIAFILWVIFAIGLKLVMLWLDPKYRKAYTKWQSPTRPFQILRAFPAHEIGWYVATMAAFALMLWWMT